jgi:hypothetical protein
MQQNTSDYFRRREQIERAAAKAATCGPARRAHQELAILYAARTRRLVNGH